MRACGDFGPRVSYDALLAIKEQEDAGIDIVTDGEQSRQHFVHGFLTKIEGIDFARRVEMGIRADRYKAMGRDRRGSATAAGARAPRGPACAGGHSAQAQMHPPRACSTAVRERPRAIAAQMRQ
jgi:methionine synthase II (cobalamin-independent)